MEDRHAARRLAQFVNARRNTVLRRFTMDQLDRWYDRIVEYRQVGADNGAQWWMLETLDNALMRISTEIDYRTDYGVYEQLEEDEPYIFEDANNGETMSYAQHIARCL